MDLLTAKLTLSLAPGVGPVKFKEILALDLNCNWSQQSTLLETLPLEEAAKNFLKKRHELIETILIWREQAHHHLICVDDPHYPKLLKEIHDPPPFLYVKGNVANLHEPQLGIVGCREMSAYGQMLAFRFAKELANLGITVTSGLAFGIDGTAHEGALQAKGNTIAVLGTGLNLIYPEAHTQLSENILNNAGTLVSELPPNTGIKREHFPRRNRIISGLSLGVLVVEAKEKSGSLITAKYALEQNRPVFAVPGSIDSAQSRGCHQLLREGARLTEKISDVLEELYQPLNQWVKAGKTAQPLDKCAMIKEIKLDLLEHLSFNTPSTLDALALISAITREALQKDLLALELTGKIKRVPGGYIKNKGIN